MRKSWQSLCEEGEYRKQKEAAVGEHGWSQQETAGKRNQDHSPADQALKHQRRNEAAARTQDTPTRKLIVYNFIISIVSQATTLLAAFLLFLSIYPVIFFVPIGSFR
ncbi:unnamed protein product [Sphagnum balticum]